MEWPATALVAVAAAGLTFIPAARPASTPAAAPPVLCGIAEPIDALVCDREPDGTEASTSSSSPSSPTSSSPASASTSSSSSSSSSSSERRVHRSSTTIRYDRTRIIVRFARRATEAEIRRALAQAGVTVERRLARIGLTVVRVEPERQDEALRSLHSSAAVASSERDVLAERMAVQPDDEAWGEQWGLRLIGAPRAWEVTKGSQSVVVAVVDTGVDSSHPDLQGAVVAGHDFVGEDPAALDDHGHGTAVAGVIAARSNNRRGSAGVCWFCRIMPVKVLDDHGVGSTSVIAAGIIWAVDRGSRVINLSLGAPATTEALSEAVRYALSKGALVVAAAGNDGSTFPFYPAADPGVISVAGTDERDGLYTWSNRGAPVRFGAPGCNIAPWPGSRLVEFCGTSSAAPVVSGTVALMVSAKPAAAPSEVESDLSKFAVPVPDVGRGRIDAARAVAAVSTTAVTHATVRSNGRPASYRLTAAAGVVEATLTSASATSFTITLRDARGRTLAVASGRAPVRLTRTIPAGPYTISARSSTTRNRFTVNVSYPREA